jgi:hypothetical protein
MEELYLLLRERRWTDECDVAFVTDFM